MIERYTPDQIANGFIDAGPATPTDDALVRELLARLAGAEAELATERQRADNFREMAIGSMDTVDQYRAAVKTLRDTIDELNRRYKMVVQFNVALIRSHADTESFHAPEDDAGLWRGQNRINRFLDDDDDGLESLSN